MVNGAAALENSLTVPHKIELPHEPAFPLLPREVKICVHLKTFAQMFKAALLLVAKENIGKSLAAYE